MTTERDLAAYVERLERRIERERARRAAAERHVDQYSRALLQDPQTGLLTRLALVDRLQLALHRSERTAGRVGLLVFDLDEFRAVNAEFGTDAGDAVLDTVGRRLTDWAGADAAVARVGGDEFAVLFPDIADADDLRVRAAEVAALLAEPITLPGLSTQASPVGLRAGTGLKMADPAELPEVVLREAEAALYVAKSGSAGGVAVFGSESDRVAERRAFGRDLDTALEDGHLSAWFQPVVDVRTGEVTGAEALARWSHPDRGMIPPNEFVERAEDLGFVERITDRILALTAAEARCDTALSWHVNLAARDLADPRLPGRIAQVWGRGGVPWERLCLEITERALVTDDEITMGNLDELRERGVRFALDDFGVEYSSLSYLRKFPVEVLKIDRFFIEDVAHQPRDRALVQAIVAMAAALDMRTVAEGVETADQLAVLQDVGVDEAQGWLFGRPGPTGVWRPGNYVPI